MARILVMCSRMPYPLTGGAKLRMFYTARELAREHNIELLVIEKESVDESAISSLEKIFDDVHVFTFPQYRFYMNASFGTLSQRPLQTHYYEFDTVNEWLDENNQRFDLLYCNHVRTTEYARTHDTPSVVDLVDAISRNYRETSGDASGIWRFIYPIEWRRLRRYERRIVREFTHAFIITEADRQFIIDRNQSSSFSVLSNGVKPKLIEKYNPTYRPDPDSPRIVFLGKMNYFPNEDAAEYFVKQIFPHVRTSHPTAEFLIVGASPTSRVQKLSEYDRVTVTGFVDDPKEYIKQADIVVAPMRHGAGLQNKVLEGMALGRPVVTTSLAREGINARDGNHLVVADDPNSFAASINHLISDIDKRRQIGESARELIEREHTWAYIGRQLRSRIRKILSVNKPDDESTNNRVSSNKGSN